MEENKLEIIESTPSSFIANYKSGNLAFTYHSKISGTITKSVLKITNSSNNKEKIILTNFTIDPSLPSYKLVSHETVISEAENVKKNFSLSEIRNVIKLYEVFGEQILAQQQVDHSSQLIQSLFFHNAIFTSINRSLEKNTDCGCTPHPAYFIGKTSFWCQEDYFIDPRLYIKAIDDSKYPMNAMEMKVYNYLQNNKSQPTISIDKLLNILETKASYMQRVSSVYYESTNKILKNSSTSQQLDADRLNRDMERQSIGIDDRPAGRRESKSDCLKGSDLGCCGNYSRCCWYWSMLCLAHDIDCLNCDHWHCGPACKKGVEKSIEIPLPKPLPGDGLKPLTWDTLNNM